MTESAMPLVTIEAPLLGVILLALFLSVCLNLVSWVGFLQTWTALKDSKGNTYLAEDGRLPLGIAAIVIQGIVLVFLAMAL